MLKHIFIILFISTVGIAATYGQKSHISKIKLNTNYIDVTKYPDYTRRQFTVPSWETFNNRVHLVGLRYGLTESAISNTVGDILRPNLGWVRQNETKLTNLCNVVKTEDKFIWNVGGYIPEIPDHAGGFYYNDILLSQQLLGDRFLGMDVGEQDGRYVWQYNSQYYLSYNQKKEYHKFHRMFTKVTEDQAEKMTLLTTLWGWHYPVKDGVSMMQAAETQNKAAITNAQIQYSFLRGACRQYGTLLAGDVSVFTTWNDQKSSYSLKKKLSLAQYQYNSAIISFEDTHGSGLKDELHTFINDGHERPGPMHAPIAFLFDFYNGWMPGFWWSGQYMKWCWLPYEKGDYLTHNLFSMVYPQYEDNGVFRDETKVSVPTPFGDMFDCLLSDVTVPVMQNYAVIVAGGDLALTAGIELKEKIESYVENGGNFVVTAENAKKIWTEWEISNLQTIASGASVVWENYFIPSTETLSIEFYSLNETALPNGFIKQASWEGNTMVYDIPLGDGFITLTMSPWGMNKTKQNISQRAHPHFNEIPARQPLGKPFVLANHFKSLLSEKFAAQKLFSVGNTNHFSYITNYRGNNQFLVGITNTTLSRQNFNIQCHIGDVVSVDEWMLPNRISDDEFYPQGFTGDGLDNTATAIAAFDTRLFLVTIEPDNSTFKTTESPVFPNRPENRMIRLENLEFAKEQILNSPTFFEHFDGVLINYRDLYRYDEKTLENEAAWFNRQKLRFIVDFRDGVQKEFLELKYDTSANSKYRQTLNIFENVFSKMKLLDYAKDITLAVNSDDGADGLVEICGLANQYDVNVHTKNIGVGDVWSFEQGVLAPWKKQTKGSSTIEITTENVRNGYFALKLEGDSNAVATLTVPVKPETEYIFGGYLKVANNQKAHIGVTDFGGDSITQSFSGNGVNYHENMLTFTTTKDVYEVTVFIEKSENTDWANADDLFFRALNADSVATSAPERDLASETIRIFPNPVTGKLNIHSEGEIDTVIIRDLSGKLIERQRAKNNRNNIVLDLSYLHSGLYFVQVQTLRNIFCEKIFKI